MDELFAEGESEAVEQDREYLEVVLLLVTNDIDHLVDGVVLVAQLGGTDILGHIDRRAVGAEQQFLIQSVFLEVGPNGSVWAAVELTGSQSFLYFGFALQVGV